MRVIARSTLREYWQSHADVEEALKDWFRETENAEWKTPQEMKAAHPDASILANNRVVFNIRGNRYRLVVRIRYEIGIIYIRFIGTHAEYNRIDAETI